MSSPTITTVIKMLESLPELAQRQALEHLREYLGELRDEADWDVVFARTQSQLASAARQAKREIAEGRAKPLDLGQL